MAPPPSRRASRRLIGLIQDATRMIAPRRFSGTICRGVCWRLDLRSVGGCLWCLALASLATPFRSGIGLAARMFGAMGSQQKSVFVHVSVWVCGSLAMRQDHAEAPEQSGSCRFPFRTLCPGVCAAPMLSREVGSRSHPIRSQSSSPKPRIHTRSATFVGPLVAPFFARWPALRPRSAPTSSS